MYFAIVFSPFPVSAIPIRVNITPDYYNVSVMTDVKTGSYFLGKSALAAPHNFNNIGCARKSRNIICIDSS